MDDEHSLTQRVAAEFLGTFVLVFGGCGAAVLASGVPDVGIGFLGVSLAFGLTVVTMAYAVGHVSGGHFNPAVTLGLAFAGRFRWKDAVPYAVTQVVAAIAAATVLFIVPSVFLFSMEKEKCFCKREPTTNITLQVCGVMPVAHIQDREKKSFLLLKED